MTDQPDAPTVTRRPSGGRWRFGCGLGLGLVLLAFVAPLIGVLWWFELPWHLLTGWWNFARRSAERCHVVWSDVGLAAAAAGALVVGVHRVARWIVALGSGQTWPVLRSMQLVAGTLLLFAAGIALLGITHQGYWLSQSDSRLLDNNLLEFQPHRRQALHQLGEALTQSAGLPEGAASHSWALPLLPYLDDGPLAERIDTSIPWNDRRNAEAMRTSIPALLSPAMTGTHDARGFAISHFAANQHVARIRGAWPGQGDENTILIGEAFLRHRPWGDPQNVRDPLDGINRKPDGFGCPGSNAALFLMGDGSVRRLSDQIDRKVLQQMSVPKSGREPLP